MIAQLRSELFKQRTTRTNLALLLSMISLVSAAVLLHMLTLPVENLSGREGQLKVIGLGTTFAMIFAALLGAMSITSEIRNGMIRPTFLASPDRAKVILAKAAASAIAGAALGLVAEGLAAGVGSAGLAGRGIPLALSAGDLAQLVVGGAIAASFLAMIGVGVGAVVRNQAAASIGVVVWLLFAEMILIGSLPALGKVLPGASGGALAGAMLEQTATYLLAPPLAALLIVVYASAATVAGLAATARRDIA